MAWGLRSDGEGRMLGVRGRFEIACILGVRVGLAMGS